MDRRLIDEKLESLRRCVERVESKCPQSAKMLVEDLDRQDIIALNLTRAVQLCVDIASHIISESEFKAPDTMAGVFQTLLEMDVIDFALAERMKKAVGFRNIAVHSYEDVNWEIVYSICSQRTKDFKSFAVCIVKTVIAC